MTSLRTETFSEMLEGPVEVYYPMYVGFAREIINKMHKNYWENKHPFKYWVDHIYGKTTYHLFIIAKKQAMAWEHCLKTYNLEKDIFYKSDNYVFNQLYPVDGPKLMVYILKKKR